MSSLQKEEFALALYPNLFDQKAGNELYRQFLNSPEVAGSRNAKTVKIRRLGVLNSALYGGPGSISSYQRPNDLTISVDFDKTQVVPIGVDSIEHEMTAIGIEGSAAALAQDAASAVIDAIVTDVLVTAEAGATALTVGATILAATLIEAKVALNEALVPTSDRIAIIASANSGDLFDGTSKIGLDNRELSSINQSGIIPRLHGFEIFETTLLPAGTNAIFAHKSAMIVKTADELPNVKFLDDDESLGELIQVWLRYGQVVADVTRIYKMNTS